MWDYLFQLFLRGLGIGLGSFTGSRSTEKMGGGSGGFRLAGGAFSAPVQGE